MNDKNTKLIRIVFGKHKHKYGLVNDFIMVNIDDITKIVHEQNLIYLTPSHKEFPDSLSISDNEMQQLLALIDKPSK